MDAEILTRVRISFGIIVLNGMPFIPYLLRQIYPYAHEIIVVEGASEYAKDIATSDGHSTDATLDVLNEFKSREDTRNIIRVITNEGFWTEKLEQSQAFAKRVTGNYLWELGADEFYKNKDIERIITLLDNHPEITMVSFNQIAFWGGFEYVTEGYYLKYVLDNINRIFKFDKGYQYINHRPSTVVDAEGINLKDKHHLGGNIMCKKYGIYLYHYSTVFPKQVYEKSKYYEKVFNPGFLNWFENSFLELKNPFRVHGAFGYRSWIKRFKGKHPEQIYNVIDDLKKTYLTIETRKNDDVDKILNSNSYRIKRFTFSKTLFLQHHLKKVRRFIFNKS